MIPSGRIENSTFRYFEILWVLRKRLKTVFLLFFEILQIMSKVGMRYILRKVCKKIFFSKITLFRNSHFFLTIGKFWIKKNNYRDEKFSPSYIYIYFIQINDWLCTPLRNKLDQNSQMRNSFFFDYIFQLLTLFHLYLPIFSPFSTYEEKK